MPEGNLRCIGIRFDPAHEWVTSCPDHEKEFASRAPDFQHMARRSQIGPEHANFASQEKPPGSRGPAGSTIGVVASGVEQRFAAGLRLGSQVAKTADSAGHQLNRVGQSTVADVLEPAEWLRIVCAAETTGNGDQVVRTVTHDRVGNGDGCCSPDAGRNGR